MANDWIIDVLADLTELARKNGLPALERQLRDTVMIASLELASTQGIAGEAARRGVQDAGSLYRRPPESRNI